MRKQCPFWLREGRMESEHSAAKWDAGGEGWQNGSLAEEREGIKPTSITVVCLLHEQLFLCVRSLMSVEVLSHSSYSQMGCVVLSRLWPFIFTQSGFSVVGTGVSHMKVMGLISCPGPLLLWSLHTCYCVLSRYSTSLPHSRSVGVRGRTVCPGCHLGPVVSLPIMTL